jgi:flagellar protein FliJ
MKALKFPLQTVLKMRELAEQKAMELYASALREQKSACDGAQRAQANLTEHQRAWRDQAMRGCNAGEMTRSNGYCLHLRALCCDWERRVEAAAGKCKEALSEMINARRQRELVDKLRERQLAAHRFEESRQEVKWLDELSAQRREKLDLQLV